MRREAVEKRFRRILGPSADDRARQHDTLDAMNDWHGVCQKCGAKLQGTVADIAEHVCRGEK